MANGSDYIVRAVVKSVSSEWREKQGHRHIITKVELDVLEVINGTPPQPLVLEMLGGRVGNEELIVHGAPKFQVGQEDILFIHGNGRNISPLLAIMHGRYPIEKEAGTGRRYVARSNHTPLQDTAEITLSMDDDNIATAQSLTANVSRAMTPDQFAERIKAAIKPSSHHDAQQK